MKKRSEESEFQIKQKSKKVREQIDDIKDSIRKEKKDHEKESQVKEIQEKIRLAEERIKLLSPISSALKEDRFAVVIAHVKGGDELKAMVEQTKEADILMEKMAKQQATAHALVKASSSILTQKRSSSSSSSSRAPGGADANDVEKLRTALALYQSAKRQFVEASQSGKLSSSIIMQMKRLISRCDDLNETEDQLSAKFVALEQETSKAMGEAWAQTAVHKFKLDVGIIPPSNGKEAKLLDMEEEVGQTMLEEREACQQRLVERLHSEAHVFHTLAAGHQERTAALQRGTKHTLTDQTKQLQRELGTCNRQYRAGKECEKQVLHEFEKLKVGYLAGYHQDKTKELKLQRKVDRRQKLLEAHLQNIQTSQDKIVTSVEEDWAILVEREEVRGDAVLASTRESRVTTTAQLRVDTVNHIESAYKPAIVELMTNIKVLAVRDTELEQKTSAVENELRTTMEEQNEIDQEFFKLKLLMARGSTTSDQLEKYQRQLRLLWRQGAVPMATVESFLDQLSENTEPNDTMLGMYESYSERLGNTEVAVAVVADGPNDQ